MKKYIFFLSISAILLTSCGTTSKVTKSTAYKGMYNEQPLTILLMPPINRSTNVESKEYFHSTLNVPLANAGFYVVPPFLSMDILKKESAYDSEMFLNAPLQKFQEVFGADLAVFTIINKWDKSSLGSNVKVQVEYIIKSTKTNETLYTRKGEVNYDTSVSTGAAGVFGLVADLALSALNTAATKYVGVARTCNLYTFKDLPAGKYSPNFNLDGAEFSGPQEFTVSLNQNYN